MNIMAKGSEAEVVFYHHTLLNFPAP